LITTSDLKDESVVAFLKGGQKKELEVEAATFVTKWLMDRDVPFGIDFDSCGVDRAIVIESLPKRLQKILGATAAVVAESADVAPNDEAEKTVESASGEQVAAVEETAQVDEGRAVEQAGEGEVLAAERPDGDGDMDGSSELR
jgi:hypothetical protein